VTPREFSAQCEAERRGGWRANVADLECEARAKRLDQLKEEVALAIHQETGIELCDIVVRLEGVFPDALSRFHNAHETIAEANRRRDEAAREIRQVVAQLRAENLTMRDISALLGITPQRVAQLAHSDISVAPSH
jgi:predicted XRE-type DNA-binding protein